MSVRMIAEFVFLLICCLNWEIERHDTYAKDLKLAASQKFHKQAYKDYCNSEFNHGFDYYITDMCRCC